MAPFNGIDVVFLGILTVVFLRLVDRVYSTRYSSRYRISEGTPQHIPYDVDDSTPPSMKMYFLSCF